MKEEKKIKTKNILKHRHMSYLVLYFMFPKSIREEIFLQSFIRFVQWLNASTICDFSNISIVWTIFHKNHNDKFFLHA